MRRLAGSLLALAGALLFAAAEPALAQFPWAGARATGMGGAQVAAVDDATAAWSNPAALSGLKGWNFQLFGGTLAANRNNLIGTLDALGKLPPFDEITAVDVPVLIGGIVNLARPDTSVISSGVVGLVASYQGFALSIGDVPYAGIYPVIDLEHVIPGGGPDNGLAHNTTGLYLAGLSAREARVAYGHEFFGGVLSVGGAARYVSGVTYFGRCGVFDCRGKNLSDLVREAFQQNARTTNKFMFDLGARANFGIVKLGVVGIALNQPEFAVADVLGSPGTIPLPRQVRGGAAVDPLPFLTLAIDGDFIRSDTLAPGVKSQELSLGAEVRIPLFAFRIGAVSDLGAVDPHWAYSFGLGFGIPVVSVDAAIVWTPQGGLNVNNPNREALGGSAGVRVHF